MVGYLITPSPGLEVKILPVGEGSTGQEVLLYIVKWSLDPGLSIGVVNPMRPESDVVHSGKRLHFRGEGGIRAGAVTDNDTGIIDDAAAAGALHIGHGLGQEGFAFKPGESRVVLYKKLPTKGQGEAGTLGGKQTAPYFESMRRGVVLHLLARLEMIASCPLLCRDADLILTDHPGQALIRDLDIIAGTKLLLNPDDIALTVAEEFADFFYILVIFRRLADR